MAWWKSSNSNVNKVDGASISNSSVDIEPSKGNFLTKAGTAIYNNPGRTALGLGAMGALGVGAYALMGRDYDSSSVSAGTGVQTNSGGGSGLLSAGKDGSGDTLTRMIQNSDSKKVSNELDFYDRFNAKILKPDTPKETTASISGVPTGTVQTNFVNALPPPSLADILGTDKS